MTSEANRWQRVRQVFQATLERPDADRARFLREACTGDSDLRREVESLLDAHGAAAGHFTGIARDSRAWTRQRRTESSMPGENRRVVQSPVAVPRCGQSRQARASALTKSSGWSARAVWARSIARTTASWDVTWRSRYFRLELANDPDRLSRFDREARALAALNHPNIATIHGIAQTAEAASSGQASVRAIVLELVEGPTLSERLARGPVPLDEALAIARQIAEALDAAHEKGIVHRDLKPSNI